MAGRKQDSKRVPRYSSKGGGTASGAFPADDLRPPVWVIQTGLIEKPFSDSDVAGILQTERREDGGIRIEECGPPEGAKIRFHLQHLMSASVE